jgi:hypothetical protein
VDAIPPPVAQRGWVLGLFLYPALVLTDLLQHFGDPGPLTGPGQDVLPSFPDEGPSPTSPCNSCFQNFAKPAVK